MYKGDEKIKNKIIIPVGVSVIVLSVTSVILSLFLMGIIRLPTAEEKSSKVLPDIIKLTDLGSASELEGNVTLVSVFANDSRYSWDFNDENDISARENIFSYTKTAADWICEQAQRYNKTLNISYAEDSKSDLYYETAFDEKCLDIEKSISKSALPEWKYIDSKIDNNAIKSKYKSDSVVYLIFINQKEEYGTVAFALSFYDRVLDYPYEICFLPYFFAENVISPSVIAHEILHTFGAPDLYGYDEYKMNYDTTVEYVDYCRKNHYNEIMHSTFDISEGVIKRVYDRITNDLTDITAYYIGWIDEPPAEVDEFALVHSQHEYYSRHKQDKD